MLGYLYDFSMEPSGQSLVFQEFLNKYDNLSHSSNPSARLFEVWFNFQINNQKNSCIIQLTLIFDLSYFCSIVFSRLHRLKKVIEKFVDIFLVTSIVLYLYYPYGANWMWLFESYTVPEKHPFFGFFYDLIYTFNWSFKNRVKASHKSEGSWHCKVSPILIFLNKPQVARDN